MVGRSMTSGTSPRANRLSETRVGSSAWLPDCEVKGPRERPGPVGRPRSVELALLAAGVAGPDGGGWLSGFRITPEPFRGRIVLAPKIVSGRGTYGQYGISCTRANTRKERLHFRF